MADCIVLAYSLYGRKGIVGRELVLCMQRKVSACMTSPVHFFFSSFLSFFSLRFSAGVRWAVF